MNIFKKTHSIKYLQDHQEDLSSTQYNDKDALRLLNYFLKHQEFDQYYSLLDKLLSNNNYSKDILELGMETRFAQRDYSNAYHLAKKLCYEFDKPKNSLYKLGYLAHLRQDYRFAINWITEHRQNLKKSRDGLDILLGSHLRLGNFRDALEIAVQLDPNGEQTKWLADIVEKGRRVRNKDWYGRKGRPLKRLDSLHWRNHILRDELKYQAQDLLDIDRGINEREYVSDERLFNAIDYWQYPSQFEQRGQGDCEDFALWVWIQLLRLNIKARFVLGGWHSNTLNHAWVCIYHNRDVKVLECTPQECNTPIPIRYAHDYVPLYSMDKNLIWYQH